MAGAVRPGGAPAAAPAVSPAAAPMAGTATVSASTPQSATRKMSFLAHLKPTKLADAKPSNHVLVVGNKGCKTIAAVAVDVPDGFSPNGRMAIKATPGLPRPEGSKVVLITFDNQSSQSLLNHYGPLIDGHDISIFHLLDPVIDDNGVVLYPGWDGGTADSGIVVAAAFKELLIALRDTKNVGMLIVDHYGKFLEEVCKFYAYAKAKMPLDMKLDPGQWTPRANLINDIDFLVRSAAMDGGWVICTGSRDRHEGNEVTTFEKDRKEFAKKEIVPAKWTEKILHNWANVIQVYKVAYQNGGYAWQGEVEEGRHPLLPLGAQVDLTGRHIGAFQDAKAVRFVEPPQPEAKATIATITAKK